MLEFDIEGVHIPGSHHQAPDAVLRLPKKTEDDVEAPIDDELPSFNMETEIGSPVMMLEHQPMPIPFMAALTDAPRMDTYSRDLRK